jgi:uncharacterized membrane protein HdeD (DUF308 family)
MASTDEEVGWSFRSVAESVRVSSRWMEVMGFVLILCGIVALGSAVAASLATTFVLGGALLTAGVLQIALTIAYWIRRRAGFSLGIILGCLCVIAGLFCLSNPAETLRVLTFILALYCISSGAVRLTITLSERFPGWGWGVVAALADAVLGILILAWWPATSLIVLGTLVGVQLIISGANAFATGHAVRRFLAPIEPHRHIPGRPATRFQH